MGGLKVAIIGAGRMGSLLATHMRGNARKVIISQQKARASSLADEVGALASDQLSAVRGCQAIFLTVPGTAVRQVVQEMAPHAEEGALVVNMVTDVMTDDLAAAFPKLRFAAAKVLGHAREMSTGSPGVVVLDHMDSHAEEERLRSLLGGLGPVTRGAESLVMEANAAVVEAMVRAAADLRGRLEALGLDQNLIQVAITTTGPGVLRSLSEGDAGPYAQSIIEKLRAGETAAPGASH